jgi:hypothetical protein
VSTSLRFSQSRPTLARTVQVELARIKTELIIKDDYLIETLEILEVYFNVVLSRMGLIERQKCVSPQLAVPFLDLSRTHCVWGCVGVYGPPL